MATYQPTQNSTREQSPTPEERGLWREPRQITMLLFRGGVTLDKFVLDISPARKEISRYGLTVVEDPDTFTPLEPDRARV